MNSREWDQADPLIFEVWVLEELRKAGFRVAMTPLSGDGGVDGIGLAPAGSAIPAVLVQCKHVQGGRTLGPAAVREALAGLGRYELPAGTLAMVVTNAPNFSSTALAEARRGGARLVGRDDLVRLRELARSLLRGDVQVNEGG